MPSHVAKPGSSKPPLKAEQARNNTKNLRQHPPEPEVETNTTSSGKFHTKKSKLHPDSKTGKKKDPLTDTNCDRRKINPDYNQDEKGSKKEQNIAYMQAKKKKQKQMEKIARLS